MKVIFPIPRITERFFDKVIEKVGGRRISEREKKGGVQNADYLLPGAIVELKIIEEEGLEKESRQNRIKKLLTDKYILPNEVDIDIKRIPDEIKPEYRQILGGPIKTAVKKAAKQIKETKMHLKRNLDLGVLIVVNNGYASLPHDEFENLVLSYATRDTSQIDFIICSTVDHHQGDFDTYVFLTSHCYPIQVGLKYHNADELIQAINEVFGESMTYMMRNQMDQKLWDNNLPPISDIFFDGDEVRFIRKAPEVPDSRFNKVNTAQRHGDERS
jgi:hypothetical protein